MYTKKRYAKHPHLVPLDPMAATGGREYHLAIPVHHQAGMGSKNLHNKNNFVGTGKNIVYAKFYLYLSLLFVILFSSTINSKPERNSKDFKILLMVF
jgi:hypothetical protein